MWRHPGHTAARCFAGTFTGMTSSRPGRVGRPRLDQRTLDAPPRDEVLAVASRVFAERGFAAATMREIAAGAGLHPSSVYYYFRSKEEMLEAIVAEANRI